MKVDEVRSAAFTPPEHPDNSSARSREAPPRPAHLRQRFLLTLILLTATSRAAAGLTLEPPPAEVGRYEVIELRLNGVESLADPFDPVTADVRLEMRQGDRRWSVPAFFMQPYERRAVRTGTAVKDWFYPAELPGWRARFAPLDLGPHEAVAVWRPANGEERRSAAVRFRCVPSDRPGFLRVSPRDPRWLAFSNGQPFFPIGQNLAFIGSQQYVTVTRAEAIFRELAAHGANYVRVWAGCEDWALAIEAPKSAWSRSWEARAPLVPLPDEPARRGVRLSPTPLEVRPSHDVALRPSTAYALQGRLRAASPGRLRLEIQGATAPDCPVTEPHTWTRFRHDFTTGDRDRWLTGLRLRWEGGEAAWLAELSLTERDGGPELLWEAEVNRPRRGWYNPLDGFWLDELLTAAQQHDLYLQLCLLMRDLYLPALKDPASAEYDRAIADAQRLFRYAVARWGAFSSLAAWEYWNEMDPGLPTDRFYTELGEFLEATDLYGHLRTTSTWGPSPKDCRHPKLDLADVHHYLRPADHPRLRDEVEAILDRAAWLREHAPAKPALQGESGLADDQWRLLEEMRRRPEVVDFHHMLWASALSGTSGTALPWWWERLDQRQHYPLFRPLSQFLADVPWTAGNVQPFARTAADDRVRVVGLRTPDRIWLWCFHREAAWRQVVTEGRTPSRVRDAVLTIEDWPQATARVEWWDTRTGNILDTGTHAARQGTLTLPIPEFARDLAARLHP